MIDQLFDEQQAPPVIPSAARNPNGATMKQYFVCILASNSGTLYTGMMNNLQRRVYEHKKRWLKGSPVSMM